MYFLKTALWAKRMKRNQSCRSCCSSSMCPSSWWPPMSHISMHCKHFIFCSISICPSSSWWPPSAIRPQTFIANISSLDPVKMCLRIKTQMENIVFSDGHEAIFLTSYNLHHTKLHCCISHFLLWNLLRNTSDEYKDQNKQALFCPTKLTCFENKSAE